MTTDNDIAVAGSGAFSYSMILRGIEKLENAKAPKFANGRYVAVIGPTEKRQLAEDDEFQRASQFAPPQNPLLSASYPRPSPGATFTCPDAAHLEQLELGRGPPQPDVRAGRRRRLRRSGRRPGQRGPACPPVLGRQLRPRRQDLGARRALQTFDSRFAASLRTG